MSKNKEEYGYSEFVEKIADAMYEKCYIGHIERKQWLKFAKFCADFRAMSIKDIYKLLEIEKEDIREINRQLKYSRQGKK